MNEFNSIYYIHIPKTAGRWYTRAVNGPVIDILTTKKHNIFNINKKNSQLSQSTHWGWLPEIDDKTFVHTVVREPISHICSLFAHRHIGHPKWFDNQVLHSNREITDWEKQKDDMIDSLFKNKLEYSNNQSKNIFFYENKGFKDIVIKKNDPDKDLLIKKIKRINQIFTFSETEQLNHIECIYKVLQQMNINIEMKKIISFLNHHYNNSQFLFNEKFNNEFSQNVYMVLSDKDKEKLKKLSPLDNYIYEYVRNENNV